MCYYTPLSKHFLWLVVVVSLNLFNRLQLFLLFCMWFDQIELLYLTVQDGSRTCACPNHITDKLHSVCAVVAVVVDQWHINQKNTRCDWLWEKHTKSFYPNKNDRMNKSFDWKCSIWFWERTPPTVRRCSNSRRRPNCRRCRRTFRNVTS